MDDQHHHQLDTVNQSSSTPTTLLILKYVVELLDINVDHLTIFIHVVYITKTSIKHMLMVLVLLVVILVNISGHLWLVYKRITSKKVGNVCVPVLLTVLWLSHPLSGMTTSASQVVLETGNITSSVLIHSGMVNSVDW